MSLIFKGPADPGHKAEQEQVFSKHQPEPKRKKKLVVDDFYHYDQVGVAVKTPAMEQAEDFRANLPGDNPSFLKMMVRSNVTTGFWLHLPMPFCKKYMPRHNTTVSLEDEKGEEYKVNYIVDKTALSAGWKKFASAQELMEGDVVVFQLVKPYIFKVNIVRVDYSKQDGRLSLGASREQTNSGMSSGPKFFNFDLKLIQLISHDLSDGEETLPKKEVEGRSAEDILHEGTQSKILTDSNVDSGLVVHQSRDDIIGLDVTEKTGLPGSNVEMEEANDDDDFSILVHGTSINKELSRYQRAMYHELCCSQDSILHDSLLKNISSKLAAEMISEAVNIAEAISTCNASTPREEYVVWDKTLQGFELLGMKVGFLRARLENLINLNSKLDRHRDAETRQGFVKEEIEHVRGRIRKLKKMTRRLDAKMEALRADAEKHEKVFQDEVNAPW